MAIALFQASAKPSLPRQDSTRERITPSVNESVKCQPDPPVQLPPQLTVRGHSSSGMAPFVPPQASGASSTQHRHPQQASGVRPQSTQHRHPPQASGVRPQSTQHSHPPQASGVRPQSTQPSHPPQASGARPQSTQHSHPPQASGVGPQSAQPSHPQQQLQVPPKSLLQPTKISPGASAVHKGPENHNGKEQPPDRPGFGTLGRKIVVRSNFFPVKLPRSLTIHQYDVSIGPGDKYPKWLSRLIYQSLEEKYSASVFGRQKAAFDGSKTIYCHKRLSLECDKMQLHVDLKVEDEEKVRSFTVTIQYVTTMNLDLDRIQAILSDATERMPLVQALDVIMRHIPSTRLEPIGRSFFSRPANPYKLGQGLEVWPGYYQSIRPTMGWKFKLNLDTSSTAFYTAQSVIDFMCTVLRGGRGRDATSELTRDDRERFTRGRMRDADRKQFAKEIKGLKIKVTHLPYPRKYKVVGVTPLSAREQTFPLDNGRKMTVEAYFKEKHPKSPLSYPHLPCLHVGQKSKNVFIPLEFCELVEGQRCAKKLNEMQTAQMIRHITKPADERERIISEKFSSAGFSDDPVLKEFGISVSNRMIEVPARVLDPPVLTYSHKKAVRPPKNKGSWDMQRGTQFYQSVEVNGYAVLVCSRYCKEDSIKRFTKLLEERGKEMGMSFRGDPVIEYHDPYQRGAKSIKTIFESLKKNVSLIIAVIDKGQLYNEIKRIGDTSASAVATQCVMSDTVNRKCNPATVGNICLKINAKLGGVNQIIDPTSRPLLLQREPVIIFGADVTHPRAGDTSSPSIASVVASMDRTASKYQAKHHSQKHRQEIIEDLKKMTKQHLIDFYRTNHSVKPTRIIFYRDGVSEGQFDQVRYREVGAIQQACTELEKEYQPGITFLVVQKRHHTRLFPTDPRDRNGRGNNVPPGTTVEHEITHPKEFDFYLCSHAAIQGTSRPCHYHVLWDDNDFTADDIQTLSYQLCHTFWRCNRSVSYPAPAYYAHRDAAHARVLLQAQEDQLSSDGASTASGSGQLSMAEQDEAIAIHSSREGGMYFM